VVVFSFDNVSRRKIVVPLYEYKCEKCGHKFEKIEKYSAPETRKCPECGSKAKREISSSAIQFKGTGWYVTDYAGKNAAAKSSDGESKPATTKEDSSSKKSDSTKESKSKESSSKESSSKESSSKEKSKKS
jgi:putative FmdB family regulatory protein